MNFFFVSHASSSKRKRWIAGLKTGGAGRCWGGEERTDDGETFLLPARVGSFVGVSVVLPGES